MCLNPLKGFVVGRTAAGKPDYKICAHDAIGLKYDGSVLRPVFPHSQVLPDITESIDIPCGQCMECRLAHSKEWAARLMLEQQYHNESYFLTLTYDDMHVPLTHWSDITTRKHYSHMSLYKKDVQDFLKRLRIALERSGRGKIRFFCAGEYGGRTHRPHYHLIVYGLHLDDLKYYKKSSLGHTYYNSEFLSRLWGKGHVVIGEVTFESAAYVARYCLKKWNGAYKEFYDETHVAPEFCTMSRRPGIAAQYFEDHKDEIYDFDAIYLSLATGGRTIKPPAYFDRLFALDNEERMLYIKEERRYRAESKQANVSRQTTLSAEELAAARKADYLRRVSLLENFRSGLEDF